MRIKMFKSGKQWCTMGVAIVGMAVGLQMNASADTAANTTATTATSNSGSSYKSNTETGATTTTNDQSASSETDKNTDNTAGQTSGSAAVQSPSTTTTQSSENTNSNSASSNQSTNNSVNTEKKDPLNKTNETFDGLNTQFSHVNKGTKLYADASTKDAIDTVTDNNVEIDYISTANYGNRVLVKFRQSQVIAFARMSIS
ncbi:Glucan-binding domain (YG repeat) [Fructobacillus fructosus]|uniref:Glucan-binding domain (YG repeat) n=1 Tax=Fructobacillus fructosus TaxID=1631 RepID=A0ABN9YUR2_9LACO|nr:Glucan-binding domain (YG repeat) [Fructobacillus fructosus]